jgi:MFS family permease
MMRRFDLLASLRSLPNDLKLIFLSLFLWTFGIGLYTYIWSLFLRDIGADSSQVGIVYFIGFLAAALTMMPGGLLANRYDLKPIIILGWVISIPAPIFYFYAHSWPQAIPGYILLQISGFNLPAMNAYIAASAKDRASSAFGATYSAAPLGIVLSPAIGSLLLTWMDVRALFLISVAFFTLSTIVLLPIKAQPRIPQDNASPIIEIPRSRAERSLLLYIFAAAVAFGFTQPFLPLFYHDLLNLAKPQVQLAGAVQSLGAVAFAIFLGRRAEHSGKGRSIALGLLLVTLGMVALAVLRNPFLAVPFIFLAGGGRGPGYVAYSSVSSLTGTSTRGGRFGFYLTLETLGFAIGPYLGGYLYGINPVSIFAATAVCFVGLAAFALHEIKN